MKIQSLQLKNFRCFKNEIIRFHDKLTVLVGVNGSGKTALIEAVAMILGGIVRYAVSDEVWRYNLEHKDTTFSAKENVSIKANFNAFSNTFSWFDPVVEEEKEEDNSAQFDVSDRRTLDEVVNWLLELGYIPSFCTACYREGRTGDRFMKLLKSGQIVNCCQPNALMTLKEYLEDYASDDTKQKGEKVIQRELEVITNPVVKEKAREYIENIHEGQRDFRF